MSAHHHENDDHHGHENLAPGSASALIKDPVCGMTMDPSTAKHNFSYQGETYYFCSEVCRSKFVADPDSYLNASPNLKERKAPAGTVWTCPMHPEIRRDAPGSCPICGMALEPELPTAYEEPSPELRDMNRRFSFGAALAVPVFVLEMTAHAVDLHMWISGQALNWIQLFLATPVVLWAGWPFFERGIASIRNRSLNMFTLIALGIGVAWIYSVVATLLPGIFPHTMRDMDGAVPVYFEAAAVITALALLGQVLELRAREKTSGAIRALLGLVPKTARRITAAGFDEEIEIDAVVVGDRLRVRPGRRCRWTASSSTGEAPLTSPC